ncbi:MAG TPA: hypothetical protein VFO77_09675, partial [Actinoplanes sp.]|nr:hypothetical protein [Actinoplanes sp.]
GMLARLDSGSGWWFVAVAVIATVWFVRVRRAAAVGDLSTGFALTGVVGCLVSPVTWIHHMVWLLPALFLLFDAALAEPAGRRRRLRLGAFAVAVLVLSIKLRWWWWWWWGDAHGWAGALGGNVYLWISLGLLATPSVRAGGEQPDAPSSPPQTPTHSPWPEPAARTA